MDLELVRLVSQWAGAVAVLASLPYLVYANVTGVLVNLFILLSLATLWNLLAGYAGMVSVGQQAFIGAGAYLTLILAQRGMNPFVAIPFSVLATALIAFPVSRRQPLRPAAAPAGRRTGLRWA